MSSEFSYDVIVRPEEGYVRVNAQGTLDLGALKQMYASVLTSPTYRAGMNRLWDLTRIDVSGLSPGDLRSFAAFMEREALGTDTVKVAVIAARDLEYGMVRMLQILGEGVISPNLLVTRKPDEALAWVRREAGP